MRMKKNTKYKRDFTELRNDIAVILLALLITGVAVFLFIRDLTKTLTRNDKTPVATVTYKHKIVQRKFVDRAVWDRPAQNSPVYNGDTIRTASGSEATLYFAGGGNAVEIGSNTMIQVFIPEGEEEEQAVIDLNEGAVSVQTAGSKMRVNSQTGSVTVEKDSALHAAQSENETLTLAVEKGEAALIRNNADTAAASEEDETGPAEVLKEGAIIKAAPQSDNPTANENTVTGENTAAASLTMIQPAPKSKILNQNTDGKGVTVPFRWNSSFPKDESLVFETSQSKKFRQGVKTFTIKGRTELDAEFKTGVTYWRLYSAKEGSGSPSAASGRISVLQAAPPEPLLPKAAARYFYKEIAPSVQFSWTGNEQAVSYLLEAADNAEFNNPAFKKTVYSNAVTLNGMTEGSWYWRVTPQYLIRTAEPIRPSRVSSFTIEKHTALPVPEPLYPKAVADTANSENLSFSWKIVDEAAKYKLLVSQSADMSNPIINETVKGNYFEVKNAAKALPNGDYYWQVVGINENGTVLTEGKPVKLKTTDSAAKLQSVFPPDGYTIADTLCQDIRFTWKTNLTTEQRFQVSASEDFSAPAVDIKTLNASMTGIQLEVGTWYWRIISNTEGRKIESSVKKVIIAPPLDKPELIDVSNRIIVAPNKTNKFKWTAVKGADYYQIKIKHPHRDAVPVYENLFITKTEIELNLEDIKDGAYIITVQGFASSTRTSSRRYSLAQDHSFMLRRLKPVELIAPADNQQIPGITAMLNPLLLEWNSVERPAQTILTLEKAGKREPVLRTVNPDFKLTLPPLEAGKYTWHVKAVTSDGFDISAKKTFSFSVSPIPPLAAVVFSAPKKNAVLDQAFFTSNRSIKFEWSSIKDATDYSVRLYDSKKVTVLETKIPANRNSDTTTWEFKKLSLLSRGTFYIEVKAQRYLNNKILFQDGIASTFKFEIYLPQSKKPKTDETGTLYGK